MIQRDTRAITWAPGTTAPSPPQPPHNSLDEAARRQARRTLEREAITAQRQLDHFSAGYRSATDPLTVAAAESARNRRVRACEGAVQNAQTLADEARSIVRDAHAQAVASKQRGDDAGTRAYVALAQAALEEIKRRQAALALAQATLRAAQQPLLKARDYLGDAQWKRQVYRLIDARDAAHGQLATFDAPQPPLPSPRPPSRPPSPVRLPPTPPITTFAFDDEGGAWPNPPGENFQVVADFFVARARTMGSYANDWELVAFAEAEKISLVVWNEQRGGPCVRAMEYGPAPSSERPARHVAFDRAGKHYRAFDPQTPGAWGQSGTVKSRGAITDFGGGGDCLYHAALRSRSKQAVQESRMRCANVLAQLFEEDDHAMARLAWQLNIDICASKNR